jgi:hypothetical protein
MLSMALLTMAVSQVWTMRSLLKLWDEVGTLWTKLVEVAEDNDRMRDELLESVDKLESTLRRIGGGHERN